MTGREFAKAAAKAIAKIPGARDVRTYANGDFEGYAYVQRGRRVADQRMVDQHESVNLIGRDQMLAALRASGAEARAA